MRIKKKIALLLTAAMLVASVNISPYTVHAKKSKHCTTAGCSAKIEVTDIDATGHKFEETWTYDENNHWKKATCGHDEKIEVGAHEYDDFRDTTCNTCGKKRAIDPTNGTIKGICQMPYEMIAPGQSGYLMGIETYENPYGKYQYEMLILDCTLLAEGKDAWIYSTGKKKVDGKCFWSVWQPQYGYYWTLFRVYDEDGKILDEKCYGFQNI